MEPGQDSYQLLIENFPNGVVFLFEGRDPPRYTFVGGEGLDDVGLTAENLEGQPIAENRPPAVREDVIEKYRRALDGETVTFTADAEGRSFRIRVMPVDGESGDVGMGVAEDITEEQAYRRQLERQNERLEAYSRLLSHDLKNPLTVAFGHLDAARRECDSEYLDGVEDALERIEALADDELPKGTGLSAESLSALDLRTTAEAAWQNVATGEARLEVADTCEFAAEETRLRRLFENLFRNSVEHGTSDGTGPVTVTVGALEDGFYIADDGTGIPEGERDSVFDHGVSRAADGTGLGLYIVESVVDDHGWDVAVTESTSGGARFDVTGCDRAARRTHSEPRSE